jgi:hypothetical protein
MWPQCHLQHIFTGAFGAGRTLVIRISGVSEQWPDRIGCRLLHPGVNNFGVRLLDLEGGGGEDCASYFACTPLICLETKENHGSPQFD